MNSNFESLGDEFCWHAQAFAATYGSEYVDIVHILLAASEVSPVDLHDSHKLNPVSISEALAKLQIGNMPEEATEVLPKKLSPAAQEFVAKVTGFASRTKRSPTLRDIWVALSHEDCGLATLVLDQLGVDRKKLYRQVSGL